MSVARVPSPGGRELEDLRSEVTRRVGRGQRFAALYATALEHGTLLTALMARRGGIDPVDALLPTGVDTYPSLTPDVAAAFWYEREIHDLFGLRATGHPRLDPLVLPLAEGAQRPRPGAAVEPAGADPDERVLPGHLSGPGIFTIPHGPVRSGVFESVEYLVETPGEDIPHVRVRAYAKHRGVEKRFEGMVPADGVLLAERTEGIASVAHALAFSHALEDLANLTVPVAAGLTRLLYAELERVANHLDVAMKLADAAGLAVAVARFGWHKERVLRLVGRMCGSRFGRGVVVPGGVRALPGVEPANLRSELARLARDIEADERALMVTPSFLDRLRGTGPLPHALAVRHGALGPIGRASGLTDDTRRVRPYDAYDLLELPAAPSARGEDAMARLQVRWQEVREAFHLLGRAVEELSGRSGCDIRTPFSVPDGRGLGWAEAPQGEVLYAVHVVDGRIQRCKPRSASFHNLVLFHSVFAGDVLTDFPFIEASFGLSIAGVVL